jgi:hypothetical protein
VKKNTVLILCLFLMLAVFNTCKKDTAKEGSQIAVEKAVDPQQIIPEDGIKVDGKILVLGMPYEKIKEMFGVESERFQGDPKRPGEVLRYWNKEKSTISITTNKIDSVIDIHVGAGPESKVMFSIFQQAVVLGKLTWKELIQKFPDGKTEDLSGEGTVIRSYSIEAGPEGSLKYKFNISWDGEEKGYEPGPFVDNLVVDSVDLAYTYQD